MDFLLFAAENAGKETIFLEHGFIASTLFTIISSAMITYFWAWRGNDSLNSTPRVSLFNLFKYVIVHLKGNFATGTKNDRNTLFPFIVFCIILYYPARLLFHGSYFIFDLLSYISNKI